MAKLADEQNTTHCDPVVVAGIQIKKYQDRFEELEGLPAPIGTEKVYRQSEIDHITDRTYILRDYLTAISATSLAGALVQLKQLNIVVEGIESFDSIKRAEDFRAAHRLIFSIGSVISALIPERLLAQLEGLAEYQDDRIPYQDRLKMINQEAA